MKNGICFEAISLTLRTARNSRDMNGNALEGLNIVKGCIAVNERNESAKTLTGYNTDCLYIIRSSFV